MTTIEQIDVFGARIAAHVYMLIHRVNDYNHNVTSLREWDVPVRTWTVNLRPKLEGIAETLNVLLPTMEREVEGWSTRADAVSSREGQPLIGA